MNPNAGDGLARTRYMILAMLRASGVVLMVLGLWIWHGDILRDGGWPALGAPIFLLGMAESLLLPVILARCWRTPGGR